ncbi:MAG: hypothetical protein EON59_08180 [Alphaproteobacteria bacterium]|nr:MAG: hypothetical protein EON59_08180 [Alphaproteobacteria bacterium]
MSDDEQSAELRGLATVAPKELLYDTGSDAFDHVAMYRFRLIHPDDAVLLVARGGMMPTTHPARIWSEFHNAEAPEYESGIEQGRLELAEEQVGAAIEQGRLRCVFVQHGVDPSSLPDGLRQYVPTSDSLQIIPLSALKAGEVTMSWDDGPYLDFDGPEANWQATGFLLAWDDLVSLYPGLAYDHLGSSVTEPRDTSRPEAQRAHRVSGISARIQSAKGRSEKPYGKAVAALMLRASAYGIERAHAQTNKELGNWLNDEYEKLGVPSLPTVETSGRHARAVVAGLHAVMTQGGAAITS